jgi:solute carrier family 25 phosphate transporter 23/24/25/41
MKSSDVVSALAVEMEESQNERDRRVEELWKKLDPTGQGELDFKGLQKGLRRIDHREAPRAFRGKGHLADSSPLQLSRMPTRCSGPSLTLSTQAATARSSTKVGPGTGEHEGRRARPSENIRVQELRQLVPEFRIFVEAAEKQLLMLFRSIDRDKDGRLNKKELQAAFQRAGLSVPNRRLSGFFDKIDMNNDGFITFDEWRYVLPGLCLVGPFALLLCLLHNPPCRDPPECGFFVLFFFLLSTSRFSRLLCTGLPIVFALVCFFNACFVVCSMPGGEGQHLHQWLTRGLLQRFPAVYARPPRRVILGGCPLILFVHCHGQPRG